MKALQDTAAWPSDMQFLGVADILERYLPYGPVSFLLFSAQDAGTALFRFP